MPYPMAAARGVAVSGGGGYGWLVRDPNTAPIALLGGVPSASFAGASAASGSTTGRTFIFANWSRRIRQSGTIRSIKYQMLNAGTGAVMRLRLYRPDGAGNWSMVAQTDAIDPASTSAAEFSLPTPWPCQFGDALGLWIQASGGAFGNPQLRLNNVSSSESTYYIGSDETGTVAQSSMTALTGYDFCLEARGIAPWLAATGDSIAEGHNTVNDWHGVMHANQSLGSDPTAEIYYMMRQRTGNLLEYQNLALGGQKFDWVLSTGIPAAIAVLPVAIHIHCGLNDVVAARSWAAIESDLDAIASLLTTEDLWIDEILPYTGGNDTLAGTIRTYNGNLATWCSANDAHLIACHDAMGQIRVSTGELDDLLAAYDYDGAHLTQAGVAEMARIISVAMTAHYA